MKNLPEWGQRKVQDSEKKARRHSLWIRFSGMNANKKQIKELLEPLVPSGGKITTVRLLSNSAELETRQQEHHDALLRVHGRTCQGRCLNLVQTKFRLLVDESFSLLLEELRMYEADFALKSSVTSAPPTPRPSPAPRRSARGPADRMTQQCEHQPLPLPRSSHLLRRILRPKKSLQLPLRRAKTPNCPKIGQTRTRASPSPRTRDSRVTGGAIACTCPRVTTTWRAP